MKKYIMFAGILAVVVGGTVASAQYFSTAQKNALVKESVTTNQISAFDNLVAACKEVINNVPNPRGLGCGNYAWGCNGTQLRCYNTHGLPQASGSDPYANWDMVGTGGTANCSNPQPGTGGGECGGQRPSCGLTTGGGTTIPAAGTPNVSPEFNPTGVGTFGTVTLAQGSKGTGVLKLQNYLTAHGYNVGTIDGSFGAQTKVAVIAWQSARGLVADGVFGKASMDIATGVTPITNYIRTCGGKWSCPAGSGLSGVCEKLDPSCVGAVTCFGSIRCVDSTSGGTGGVNPW